VLLPQGAKVIAKKRLGIALHQRPDRNRTQVISAHTGQ
jgi:hypothetical protein